MRDGRVIHVVDDDQPMRESLKKDEEVLKSIIRRLNPRVTL